jgi:hypothetical protein
MCPEKIRDGEKGSFVDRHPVRFKSLYLAGAAGDSGAVSS